MSRRRIFVVGVALIALTAGGLATASPASALSGSCGSGYKLKYSAPLKDGSKEMGKIQLYEKGQTACAIVQRTGKSNGVRGKTSVTLNPASAPAESDEGNFEYYAGPVKTTAKGCANLRGSLTYKGTEYKFFKEKSWCSTPAKPKPSTSKAVKAANIALDQKGDRYIFGATGPSAFDCSGLVYFSFKKAGYNISRKTSQGYSLQAKKVSSPKKGDLVFYGGRGSAHHVGIYIGGGKMINAANPRAGVKISEVNYASHWYGRL